MADAQAPDHDQLQELNPPTLDHHQLQELKPIIKCEYQEGDWNVTGKFESRARFRENIEEFVHQFDDIWDKKRRKTAIADMPLYRIHVFGPRRIHLRLYILEETVEKTSRDPFCYHCRLTGWGNHFVSKRRYHFIVPEYDRRDGDLEDDCFDTPNHLLYGLIHCNGFGHLICINGVDQSNLKAPCKSDMMNFWNWTCTILKTRAISVQDVTAGKLLHVLTFGKSWYGKWGYEIRDEEYDRTIDFLRSIRVDLIATNARNINSKRALRNVVDKYRNTCSFRGLNSIGEFLNFILSFESRARLDYNSLIDSLARKFPLATVKKVLEAVLKFLKQKKVEKEYAGKVVVSMEELKAELKRDSTGGGRVIEPVLKALKFLKMDDYLIYCSTDSIELLKFEFRDKEKEADLGFFPCYGMNFDCRWPKEMVKHATAVVVEILNSSSTNSLSYQELSRKAGKQVHDPMLIHFVLSSINRAMLGNKMVLRKNNPGRNIDRFVIRDIVEQDIFKIMEVGEDLDTDVLHFHENLFSCYTDEHEVRLAIHYLLEGKHYVKEWPLGAQSSYGLRELSCLVFIRETELDRDLARPIAPGGVVTFSPDTTKRSLKFSIQYSLRKLYCAMETIKVEEIKELENVGDDELIENVLSADTKDVSVEVSGVDFTTALIYADGQRWVKCDHCNSRQSLSCTVYKDSMYKYLCQRCEFDQQGPEV